ncbi:MAG: hypothetical protein GY715_19355 [Planctomycetes bacterium]|nr:hypothetical protein [Planctomycetota bacterium]
MRTTRPAVSALAIMAFATAPAAADVLTFDDEQAYLDALATLGYSTLVEGFEGADWDPYRTTDPFNPNSAPSVTSQDITWTGNEGR